jgi:hypothetical protein
MRNLAPIALGIALSLGASGAALAACPHYPDDARSHYVENGTRHMMCLGEQLSETAESTARQVQLQQRLNEIQAQIARQQQQIQAQIAASMPSLPTVPVLP